MFRLYLKLQCRNLTILYVLLLIISHLKHHLFRVNQNLLSFSLKISNQSKGLKRLIKSRTRWALTSKVKTEVIFTNLNEIFMRGWSYDKNILIQWTIGQVIFREKKACLSSYQQPTLSHLPKSLHKYQNLQAFLFIQKKGTLRWRRWN